MSLPLTKESELFFFKKTLKYKRQEMTEPI